MGQVLVSSIRKYEVYTVENGKSEKFNLLLDDLLFNSNDDVSETVYALIDLIDDVMDIPKDCTMSFRPTRCGNHSSFGLITRIR